MLLDATQSMPGCLSYVIATDPADADALWITEVWDNAASHKASLGLPAIQAVIAKAKPLIAGSAIESKRCQSAATASGRRGLKERASFPWCFTHVDHGGLTIAVARTRPAEPAGSGGLRVGGSG